MSLSYVCGDEGNRPARRPCGDRQASSIPSFDESRTGIHCMETRGHDSNQTRLGDASRMRDLLERGGARRDYNTLPINT